MPNGVRARGNSRVANQRRNIISAGMVEATIIENAENVIIEAQDYDTSELDTKILQLENQIRGMKKQNKLDKKKQKDKFDALEAITKEQSDFVKKAIEKKFATLFEGHIELNEPVYIYNKPVEQGQIDYLLSRNAHLSSMKARCDELLDTSDEDVICSMCDLKLDCEYGHNPQPVFEDPTKRCCKWCNQKSVLPLRLRMMEDGRNFRDEMNPAEMSVGNQENILEAIIESLRENLNEGTTLTVNRSGPIPHILEVRD